MGEKLAAPPHLVSSVEYPIMYPFDSQVSFKQNGLSVAICKDYSNKLSIIEDTFRTKIVPAKLKAISLVSEKQCLEWQV